MNQTFVPLSDTQTSNAVLGRLANELRQMPPELRKAATWLLENPNEVGVSSIREVANAAGVKPNTLVRMARTIGFEGYESFRTPFRDEIRQGRESFPDRARWLQSQSRHGKLANLHADMAQANLSNIDGLFANTDAVKLKAAADEIVKAKAIYVLGVGIAHAMAQNFAYLASMAVDSVTAIPRDGSVPMDGLLRIGKKDVLLAMTFRPYRREVVEAAEMARAQGAIIIGISDSPASPVLQDAKHRFIVPMDTPQFFTSTVALSALLETLMAFVIADAGPDVIANIERFHRRRHELGLYWKE